MISVERTEEAASRVVALCAELGLSREDVATVLITVAANHMVATGVPFKRAALAVHAMYVLRANGVPDHVLVPVPK